MTFNALQRWSTSLINETMNQTTEALWLVGIEEVSVVAVMQAYVVSHQSKEWVGRWWYAIQWLSWLESSFQCRRATSAAHDCNITMMWHSKKPDSEGEARYNHCFMSRAYRIAYYVTHMQCLGPSPSATPHVGEYINYLPSIVTGTSIFYQAHSLQEYLILCCFP